MTNTCMEGKKYFKVELRVSQFEYKKFQELKNDYGLSARDVISAITQTCKPEFIIAFNKAGEQVKIQKSLFFNKK